MSGKHLSPYLTEFEDIPGTTGVRRRTLAPAAITLNQFCMSLMKAENRAAFKADEVEYLNAFR